MKAEKIGLIVLMLLLVVTVNAGIHYEITSGYFGTIDLNNDDTLNMTGGWGDSLAQIGTSEATIHNTDAQGVFSIGSFDSCTLTIYDGVFNVIETGHNNSTTIYGGNIGTLICTQDVREDGPAGAIIPMTHLYVSQWSYNETSMLLTGKWQDLAPFSIQLEDKYGISTFDNLVFIPEPSSLILLGLAGLALRRRK